MRQYNIFGIPKSFIFEGFISDMEHLRKSNATYLKIEGDRSTQELYLLAPHLYSILPERNERYNLIKEDVKFTQTYSNIDGVKRIDQKVERLDRAKLPIESLCTISALSPSQFIETIRAAEKELRELKIK